MADTLTTAQMFQMEEYRALRKEIEYYIGEYRAQERNVVIAVGVMWAWLIANHQSHWLPWLLPMLITAAAALRAHILNKHMRVISRYIETLERAFGVAGWEDFFTTNSRNVKRGNFANQFLTWALLALSIVAMLLRGRLLCA